jgi:hypothetical protein
MPTVGRRIAEAGALVATTGMLMAGCGEVTSLSRGQRYQGNQGRNTRITKAVRHLTRIMSHIAETPQSWVPSATNCTYEDDSTDTEPNGSISYVREPVSHTRPGDTCLITVGKKGETEARVGVDQPGRYNPNDVRYVHANLAGCEVELIFGVPNEGDWQANNEAGSPAQIQRADNQALSCLGEVAPALLHAATGP